MTNYIFILLCGLFVSMCGKLVWLARGQRDWKPSHEVADIVLHIALIVWGVAVLAKAL